MNREDEYGKCSICGYRGAIHKDVCSSCREQFGRFKSKYAQGESNSVDIDEYYPHEDATDGEYHSAVMGEF